MPEVYSVTYGGDFLNHPIYFPATIAGKKAADDCVWDLQSDGFPASAQVNLIDAPQADYDEFIQEVDPVYVVDCDHPYPNSAAGRENCFIGTPNVWEEEDSAVMHMGRLIDLIDRLESGDLDFDTRDKRTQAAHKLLSRELDGNPYFSTGIIEIPIAGYLITLKIEE